MLTSLIGVLAGWYLKKHLKKKQYHDEYLALERERDELNKKMSQAEDAMDRRYYLLTSEKQKNQDELNKSHSDNLILSKKIQSLSTELDQSKASSISLEQKLEVMHKEVQKLQKVNEQLNAGNKSAKSKSATFKSQNLKNRQVSNKVTDAEDAPQLQTLQHEISVLNTENSRLKKRVDEYTQKKLNLTNITTQLKLANSERQRLLDSQVFGNEKNQLIDELKMELSHSQTLLADKEKELGRYKNYLIDEEKKLVAEIESSSEKLASSESLSNEFQKKHAEDIETIKSLESGINILTQENSELQSQLADFEKEHSALKQDHNKQKYQIEQLSSQVRKLTAKPADE